MYLVNCSKSSLAKLVVFIERCSGLIQCGELEVQTTVIKYLHHLCRIIFTWKDKEICSKGRIYMIRRPTATPIAKTTAELTLTTNAAISFPAKQLIQIHDQFFVLLLVH